METDRIMKRHEEREDLAGEHKLGDLGQLIFLFLFLVIWIGDSFFLKLTMQCADYAPPMVRIILWLIIAVTGSILARRGLKRVFGEVRAEPTVIREDVFGLVRHPIYLGAILFYLSLLSVSLSLAAAALWAIIILFYVYLCLHEERLLLAKFGREYIDYQRDVPMLIPNPFRGRRRSNKS